MSGSSGRFRCTPTKSERIKHLSIHNKTRFHRLFSIAIEAIEQLSFCVKKKATQNIHLSLTFALILSPGVVGVMLRLGLLFWSSIGRFSLVFSSPFWLALTTPILASAISFRARSRSCCCRSSSFFGDFNVDEKHVSKFTDTSSLNIVNWEFYLNLTITGVFRCTAISK